MEVTSDESRTEHLKVLGCLASVKKRGEQKSKVIPKAKKQMFLGHESKITAYFLPDLESCEKATIINVIFHEK